VEIGDGPAAVTEDETGKMSLLMIRLRGNGKTPEEDDSEVRRPA